MQPEIVELGDLLDVREAGSVLIQDVWNGMSDLAPISALYELRRGPSGGLTGDGVLSTSKTKPMRVRVAMKAATATGFLEAIATSKLVPGP